MRFALLLVTACASAPPPPRPVPVERLVQPPPKTCGDAAGRLEQATRELRAPDESVLAPMRARCIEDGWSASAIECFANMSADDLKPCAERLDERQRNALFAVFAPPDTIAGLTTRLGTLHTNIAECDQFIAAVSAVLACEPMPLATRLSLGTETADFLSLPTQGLPETARARMAAVCGSSLAALQQQAVAAGCHP